MGAFLDTMRKLLGGGAPAKGAPPPVGAPEPDPETDARFAEYLAWRDALALPGIVLELAGPAQQMSGGSRVGGAFWLPEGMPVPCARDGRELAFLAQLDFGQLPALKDYPDSGVLQFFMGRGDVYGCDFDRPEAGDFAVLWHPDVSGPGAFHRTDYSGEAVDDCLPLYGAAAGQGVALQGQADTIRPDIESWLFQRDLPGFYEGALGDRIFEAADEDLTRHRVGGHPGFTQSDYRGQDGYRDVDRVLLQLWSDDDLGLMWGDTGQGQFTIRRADLLARRFDRALYQWDCC